MPTVNEIVIAYLKDNGYVGLSDGFKCGCGIDDLFPCNFGHSCQPAMSRVATEADSEDFDIGDTIYYVPKEEPKCQD